MSGKPITSKPVYGYLMDEDENFIIDDEAAPVVRQIYSLGLAGNLSLIHIFQGYEHIKEFAS